MAVPARVRRSGAPAPAVAAATRAGVSGLGRPGCRAIIAVGAPPAGRDPPGRPPTRSPRPAGPLPRGPAQAAGQTPVHDLDLAEGAHHDVGRLQVAVDHAPCCGRRPAPGTPARRCSGSAAGPRPALVRSWSRSARVRPSTSFMAKKGRPSGRRPTSWTGAMPGCWSWPAICASSRKRRTTRRSCVLLQQHLDGQVAAQLGVVAAQDSAHAAPGDLAEQMVTRRPG